MQVIPALYIKDGKAVALEGTVNSLFDENLVDMCLALKDVGVEAVYINDLNIPKVGSSSNLPIIKKVKDKTDLFIYAGGSFLSPTSVDAVVQNGADVVMLGTVAYQQPDFIKSISSKLSGKIGVSISVRGGKVTIPGWTVVSNKTAYDYAERFADHGVKYVYYSDVDSHGNMGPENYQRLLDFCKSMDFSVVSSSEISSARDVENLVVLGAPKLVGLVLNHAFYEERVDTRSIVDMISDLVLAESNEPTITD